jgi:hypothetical protein
MTSKPEVIPREGLPTIQPERRNPALATFHNLKSLKAGELVFRNLRALLNDGV